MTLKILGVPDRKVRGAESTVVAVIDFTISGLFALPATGLDSVLDKGVFMTATGGFARYTSVFSYRS